MIITARRSFISVPDYSIPPPTVSLRSIITLFFELRRYLPSDVFRSGYSNETLCTRFDVQHRLTTIGGLHAHKHIGVYSEIVIILNYLC